MNLQIDRSLKTLQVRHVAPVTRQFRKYWTWWTGQLMALLPGRVQAAIKQQDQCLQIETDGTDFIVLAQSGAQSRELGRLACNADTGCVFELPDTPTETRLILPADKVLIKEMTLPLATEENLREVMSFQIDRQTPFSADQVWYDCQVTDRNTNAQTLSVKLIVVPRKVLDEMLGRLARNRLFPDSVSVLEQNSNRVVPINLLPSGQRKKRWSGIRRKRNFFLVTANAVLLAIALATPVLQRQLAIHSLEPQLEAAVEAAKSGTQLRQQVQRLVAASEYLTKRKQSEMFVMRAMDEITRLLPDHTWVNRLDISSGEIQVQGQSSVTAALIPLLEASPLLKNVRFRSPVMRIGTTAEERFHLSADLVQEIER